MTEPTTQELKGEIEALTGRVARLKSAIGLLLYEQGISLESVENISELADRFNAASNATPPSGMITGPYQAGA